MQIITLTTDMGTSDHYVAALKGSIYRHAPEATIIDISHHVRAFDIVQASYVLQSVFREFPEGTVHIMGIDSEPVINSMEGQYPAILKYQGHYFVTSDNGFIALLLKDERPQGCWLIDNALSQPSGFHFPTKSIFVPAAIKLAQGVPPEEFASVHESWNRAFTFNPVIEENLIKGSIIHIDHYGNAITNITRELFGRFEEETPFTILFRKRDYYIDTISGSYNEVQPGERVAIFNSNDHLEIAINKGARGSSGGADTLFGLHIGDVVRVEFTPRGSATTLQSLF
jgi:S-adenosyl-L-methionine hydrolase (adenosine-forming)